MYPATELRLSPVIILRCHPGVTAALIPQAARRGHRVYALSLPPGALIARRVEIAVMQGAQWNRKRVRYLATQGAGLRKFPPAAARTPDRSAQPQIAGGPCRGGASSPEWRGGSCRWDAPPQFPRQAGYLRLVAASPPLTSPSPPPTAAALTSHLTLIKWAVPARVSRTP